MGVCKTILLKYGFLYLVASVSNSSIFRGRDSRYDRYNEARVNSDTEEDEQIG